MTDEPQALAAQAVAGDVDALTALLRRHGPQVESRLQIGSPWQSLISTEDIMQVTYLEAFLQIGKFEPKRGTSFASWLEQIAQNNLRDAIRGLCRQREPQPGKRVQLPAHGDSFMDLWDAIGATPTSATPSRDAGREEARRMLLAAIEQLPNDYAAVIRLYDLEGRPIEEVSQRMGRSSGAIHMLRARAHDRLRELLGTPSMFFSTPA